MKIHQSKLFIPLLFAMNSALAQEVLPGGIIPGNDQQIRQQEEAREREQAIAAPSLRSSVTFSSDFPVLPAETPCFNIQHFMLTVPDSVPNAVKAQGAFALPQDHFAFAREWLAHYADACVGKQGLNLIIKGLSQQILSRGYITTRVLLSEQDMSSGTLKLDLIPGVIRHVRFADQTLRGTWKNAFPTGAGALLNLRDLEQGVEQMKRVTSQDVTMQIVPTAQPGLSDVVLAVTRHKPWTIVASVDNAGSRSTGKLQGSLSLGIDNPLGLNDIFNIGATQDLSVNNKRFHSKSWNGFYSIPWGYWSATLSAYGSSYYQKIAGINQSFVASGDSQTVDIKLNRVMVRNQNDVLGIHVRLSRRFGKSYIEDTEIPQQRRNNTVFEIGLTDRHYFGKAQFDGVLDYRQGIGGFGAQDDIQPPGGGPTYRYRMAVLDANLSVPLMLGKQPLRYITTFHGQYTGNTLYYVDDLSIGSRYTVRGFDGESTLAAARGFYWRNELQIPLAQTGQSFYLGMDYGQVWGPQPVMLAATQLAGAVLGIKGGKATRLGTYSYDLFVGTPVYKPAQFETARATVGFQLTAQF